jgi:hypothetical protein
MATKTTKKQPMVLIAVRIPREVADRIKKRAADASRRAGVPVKVGSIMRLILEEGA